MIEYTAYIATADVPNKNKRVYTKETLDEVIRKSQEKGEILGCLGGPMTPTIGLLDVSHKITDLHLEDGKLIGTVTTLNTEKGKILENLFLEKVNVDFRLHGTGNLAIQPDGSQIVENFELIAVHAVLNGA